MSDARQTEIMLIKQAALLIGTVIVLALELLFPGNYLFLLVGVLLIYEVAVLSGHARGMRRFHGVLEGVRRGEPLPNPDSLPAAIRPMAGDLIAIVNDLQTKIGANRRKQSELEERLERSVATMEEVITGAAEQQAMFSEFNKALEALSHSISNSTSHMETLSTSAEESSSSILQMTMTNEEVAENMTVMSASVRDTVSSIDQMAHSIRESAENIDGLSAAAEETSSSMTEIDRSVDQVQSNAKETAEIIADVAVDAERGAEAIAKTLETINRIKDSSQEAVNVISSLGQKIGAIGHILNVIDDVAEQTNLLALNAAIIAAQAGEHGKGFAVVADEIKELSERSGVSTKEIADLIKSIQAESRNAIAAVEEGNNKVDEGVRVSAEAEQALIQILDIAKKSTEMMNAIARATVEQSYGSKQVTDAISRIAENVQQIAQATQEQARGSELIIAGAETMRSITQHVERSTAEQANGGRQITKHIEEISSKVRQLANAHGQQRNDIDKLKEFAMRIEYLTRAQDDQLTQARGALDAVEKSLAGK